MSGAHCTAGFPNLDHDRNLNLSGLRLLVPQPPKNCTLWYTFAFFYDLNVVVPGTYDDRRPSSSNFAFRRGELSSQEVSDYENRTKQNDFTKLNPDASGLRQSRACGIPTTSLQILRFCSFLFVLNPAWPKQ